MDHYNRSEASEGVITLDQHINCYLLEILQYFYFIVDYAVHGRKTEHWPLALLLKAVIYR